MNNVNIKSHTLLHREFFHLFNLWLVTSSHVTLVSAVIWQINPFFVFIGYCLLNVLQEDYFIIDSAWAIINANISVFWEL